MDCKSLFLGTSTLQSAVVMKCLSLRATFVTASQSGKDARRAVRGEPLIEARNKGSFHARLDTSVIGHEAGFHWLSIELHMEQVHAVDMNPANGKSSAGWSLLVLRQKTACMQWIKASVMTEVNDPGELSFSLIVRSVPICLWSIRHLISTRTLIKSTVNIFANMADN